MALRDALISVLQTQADLKLPDGRQCLDFISQLVNASDDEIQANYDLNVDSDPLRRAKLTADQLGAASLDPSAPDPVLNSVDEQVLAEDPPQNS